jgi:hypothetical protein
MKKRQRQEVMNEVAKVGKLIRRDGCYGLNGVGH